MKDTKDALVEATTPKPKEGETLSEAEKLRRQEEADFMRVVNENSTEWHDWEPRKKFMSFMRFCMSKGHKEWVSRIAKRATFELERDGYVRAEPFGWMKEDEIRMSGLEKQPDGNYRIADKERYDAYNKLKREQRDKEAKREYAKQKQNEYLDKLVEQGEYGH